MPASTSPAPAVLPPEPRYLLLPVQVPQAPVVRLDELNEHSARRASDVYPTTMSTSIRSEKERRNFVKLVQARFSQITRENHDIIAGQGTVEQRDACLKQQKKWAQNFQRNWIGETSWIQKFIAGAIYWCDYQVRINNMHRHVKLLSIAADRENEVARTARRARGREYKEAIAVHQEHIRGSVARMIQGTEDKIAAVGRGRTARAGEAQLRDLQRELTNLRLYEGGILPKNTRAVFRIVDIEPEEELFEELSTANRAAWLRGLFNKDVFVSWLCEFQGVLHFRSNWDDHRIRTMYEDKFVILADNVAKFRADLNMAYIKFKEADATLHTTGPGGMGGYDQLFVTGSPLQATRASRKRGWNEEEDEDEEFARAIQRSRR